MGVFFLLLSFFSFLQPGQKDCDLPKSYSYNQLPNAGSSEPGGGGGRLNVSGGICEPHNLHQDQVNEIDEHPLVEEISALTVSITVF